jgi:hypothetical protein
LDGSIERVEGTLSLGGKITVHSKISPGRTFPLVVSEFETARTLVLRGGMPIGLFKGERMYRLTRMRDDGVEFTMREEFSGLLAPLITKSIPDLQPYLDEFAPGLEARAEAAAVHRAPYVQ